MIFRQGLLPLLLLGLWEARAGGARPRFPQVKLFQLEDWQLASDGASVVNAKWCFACCVARQLKTCRGNWACRCTGWSAGANAHYPGSTERCGNERVIR